jgi:exosortase
LNESNPTATTGATKSRIDPLILVAGLLTLVAVIWFYGIVPRYDSNRGMSVFAWLKGSWNPDGDYEHGLMFPFVILGLIIYRFKDLREAAQKDRGSFLGLIAVFAGAAFYAISYRTFQPRIAAGGLPFLLWGACHFLWGWRVAKILIFPLFFFWLAIPLPSFQQATTHLQLLATSLTYHGASLLGVETKMMGTTILPAKGNWEPLDIATGCSGIRSLMALLMISAAWAYVAKIRLWQKALLFLSALPLAIVGNALRLISIFVIAEYGDAEWARGTWHDWSSLLIFYPFSLFLLLVLHSLLEGGLPWKKNTKRRLRREIVVKQGEAKKEENVCNAGS